MMAMLMFLLLSLILLVLLPIKRRLSTKEIRTLWAMAKDSPGTSWISPSIFQKLSIYYLGGGG